MALWNIRWHPASAILLLFMLNKCSAILPTAAIDVMQDGTVKYTLLASQASFGLYPAMKASNNLPMTPVFPPDDDELLCKEALGTADYSSFSTSSGASAEFESNVERSVMVVPRGNCTFERKALAAQRLGAAGIIIYGTLSSHYSVNKTNSTDYVYTTSDIVYPVNKMDYDCNYASANISLNLLSFDPLPYNQYINDKLMSGFAEDGNLCSRQNGGDDEFLRSCSSGRCLLTGNLTTGSNGNTMKACCAWDMHVWLYADPSIGNGVEEIKISAFYLTMEQGAQLVSAMKTASADTATGGGTSLSVVMYSRYAPQYNMSAVIIWMLGVFVAATAAYFSTKEYRYAKNVLMRRNSQIDSIASGESKNNIDFQHEMSITTRPRSLHKHDAIQQQEQIESGLPSEYEAQAQVAASVPPVQYRRQDVSNDQESLELEIGHAIGFMVFATCGLLTLFFLKIYNVVKVMYALGCSGAIMQVIIHPILTSIYAKVNVQDKLACTINSCEIGRVSRLETIAMLVSYGLGFSWLVVAFTELHPEDVTFFWIVQDIMGACMCITFLATIKVNSIKVASALLIVAFFYDIFFVFITPLIFKGGKSVMITVATSGGPPKADPSWCEKYPDDVDCQGGDPLPMLLTIPRINDYQGGSSLLGLGDIVLPGLLLSFAARYDEAKRFIGLAGGGSGRHTRAPNTCPEYGGALQWFCCRRLCNSGYFFPLIVAYAIGLGMANVAVYAMNMGQPALLYLVPCCLGTISFLGWRRGEIEEMWNTPRVIRSADTLIGGDDGDLIESADAQEIYEDMSAGSEGGGTASRSSEEGGSVPLLTMT